VEGAGGGSWTSPLTSHAWAGSALFFTTGSGELWYVTPRGAARRACALEGWAADAALLALLPDRAVFAARHWATGRVQLRTRALLPTEALVCGALDHAWVRPRVEGDAGAGAHPVVAALCRTLSAALTLYPPPGAASLEPRHLLLTGQAAIPALPLAALARDYAFVRDAVVRAAHPGAARGAMESAGGATPPPSPAAAAAAAAEDALPRAAGVTRCLVAALEEAGLLDLAFFAAAGFPEGHDRAGEGGGGGGEGGEEEEEEEEGAAGGGGERAGASRFLSEHGHRARAPALPFHWRAALALARGAYLQAVWALCAEVPALAAGVIARSGGGGGGGGEEEEEGSRAPPPLPHPHSLLAARLAVLSSASEAGGDDRSALLAADLAGDSAALLGLLARAGARGVARARALVGALAGAAAEAARAGAPPPALPPPSPPHPALIARGALPLATVDTALRALSASHSARAAPLALAAALLRASLRERFTRAAARAEAGAVGAEGGGEAEEASARASVAWGGGAGCPPPPPTTTTAAAEADDDDAHATHWPPPHIATALEGVCGPRYEVHAPHAGTGRAPRVSDGLLPVAYAHPRGGAPAPPDGAPPRCPFAQLLSPDVVAGVARGARGGGGGGGGGGGAPPPPPAPVFLGLVLRGGTLRPRRPPPLPSPLPPITFDTLQRWAGSVAPAAVRIRAGGEGARGGGGGGGGGEGGEGEGDGEGGVELSLDAMIAAAGGGGGGDSGVPAPHPLAFAEAVARGRRRLRALARGAEDAVIGYWRFEAGEEELRAGADPHQRAEATTHFADASKQGLRGHVWGGSRVAWGACDAPFDPGDGVKVKAPRCLVGGCGAAAAAPAPPARNAADPHRPDDALFQSLSALAPWGAALPFHRATLGDVGVRPWDAVNASFTLELWAKAGCWEAGVGGGGGAGAGAEEGADSGEGGDGVGSGSSPRGAPVVAPIVLAARAEYRPQARAHALQWSLTVGADGSLSFASAAGGAGAAPPALASAPAAARLGAWAHYALTVDGGAAAKEAVARARANGAAADAAAAATGAGAGADADADAGAAHAPPPALPFPAGASPPLPPLAVRLYVNGALVAEGPVRAGEALPPHALVGAPGGVADEALLLAPGATARVSEVRLWAKRRSEEELNDTKDFHLDLAQGKRMSIAIRPARLPAKAPRAQAPQAQDAPAHAAHAHAHAAAHAAHAAGGGEDAPPPTPAKRLGLAAPPPPAAAKPRPGALGAPPAPQLGSEEEGAVRRAPLAAPAPGAGGGLGAPPPGVGGGKKAEMVRRAAAAAAAAAAAVGAPAAGGTSNAE
jgi:hypothetical protein